MRCGHLSVSRHATSAGAPPWAKALYKSGLQAVRSRNWRANARSQSVRARLLEYRIVEAEVSRRGLEGQEDLWEIRAPPMPPRTYRHPAPFPEALVERCLACGCKKGGLVHDPYAGSGTTLSVAVRRGSRAIGIDLSPQYCRLARRRIIFHKGSR